jgi:hypothetical protein
MRPPMRTRRFQVSASIPSLLLGLLAFLLADCMFESKSALREGGGSETTLTGRVVDASGSPVVGAAIRVRPEGDLPPNLFSSDTGEVASAPQAFSGPGGLYNVKGLAAGSYLVECRAARGLAAVVPAELRPEDSLRLPDAVLRPTGAIKGRITIPRDSNAFPFTSIYCYVLGIWKREIADDSNGYTFLIKDVPAGAYTLRLQPAYPRDLSRWNVLELRNVAVSPGDTLDLDSLTLPDRAVLQDPVYTRDSAAAWAFYVASLDSGESPQPNWVLEHFAVTGNRLTLFYDFSGMTHRIPKEVQALDALEYINVFGNFGMHMEVSPEVSRLPNLQHFYISHANLGPFPAWTGTFPALSTLGLSSFNAFPEWVTEIPGLIYLGLGDSLTTLPKSLAKLKNLRSLGLGGNQFRTLPPVLMQMDFLQGVDLRNNRLCNTTAEEKAWITKADSLLRAEQDPLTRSWTDTLGWEETQNCGP